VFIHFDRIHKYLCIALLWQNEKYVTVGPRGVLDKEKYVFFCPGTNISDDQCENLHDGTHQSLMGLLPFWEWHPRGAPKSKIFAL